MFTPGADADGVIRVLIVDASASARQTIRQILSRSPFIEVVGTAESGREALEKVKDLHPRVVTLDLTIPGLDGLEFLKNQMAISPVAVIVVSNASEQHQLILSALDLGAADFVHKPLPSSPERMSELSEELIAKVKMAAVIPTARLRAAVFSPEPVVRKEKGKVPGGVEVVVIGISTGGPQALRYLIPKFAEDFPVPIAIVLHIPVGYTHVYAARLDELSPLSVVEATDGAPVRAGLVLIAPGGRHLTFLRNADEGVVAHLSVRPANTLHRPSVDVLFESAAEVFGHHTLGVVMTGMGSDGKQGAFRIKAQGGRIYTEAEETCVVYGMPAAVVEAGLSDRSIPLDRLAEAILEVV